MKDFYESFDHYGVKGMRWGVHKKVSNVVSDVKGRIKKKKEENKKLDSIKNKNYKQKQRLRDSMYYGEKFVKKVNRRMNKGQSYFKASRIEGAKRVGSLMLKYGSMYVGANMVLKNETRRLNNMRGPYGSVNNPIRVKKYKVES